VRKKLAWSLTAIVLLTSAAYARKYGFPDKTRFRRQLEATSFRWKKPCWEGFAFREFVVRVVYQGDRQSFECTLAGSDPFDVHIFFTFPGLRRPFAWMYFGLSRRTGKLVVDDATLLTPNELSLLDKVGNELYDAFSHSY
jgi:hypothetical protein